MTGGNGILPPVITTPDDSGIPGEPGEPEPGSGSGEITEVPGGVDVPGSGLPEPKPGNKPMKQEPKEKKRQIFGSSGILLNFLLASGKLFSTKIYSAGTRCKTECKVKKTGPDTVN